MKPTLLILAAGMASRYGSMKQIDGFGPNGETIIDYSIYDAINAGFGKITFIILEQFAPAFKEIFEKKLNGRVETDYVFQRFDLEPFGIDQKIHREKPWGTGHALLCAKDQVKEPFCIINADDFYSADAFKKMAAFLTNKTSTEHYAMVGYELIKTLSDHGSVSRGICDVNTDNLLTGITERTKVFKDGERILFEEGGQKFAADNDAVASMNFWGFHPSVFAGAEVLFREFALNNQHDPKAEFYIPLIADQVIRSRAADLEVIPTHETWFGVTYKEDKPIVQKKINELLAGGIYPNQLWEN